VALYTQLFSGYRRGFHRYLHERSGFDFEVCGGAGAASQCLESDVARDEPWRRTVTYWQWPIPRTAHRLVLAPAVLLDLLSRRYDVVVLPSDILGLDTWVACLQSRLGGVPVCIWGHATSRPDTAPRRALRHRLMRLADAVVFYSDRARATWAARGLPARKLFVAPNALDTERIAAAQARATPAAVARFCAERGLAGRDVLLYVGGLQARKRPEVLVRAMAHILRARPDALAVLIGDGSERPALEQAIAAAGVRDAVRLAGPIHDEDELALYFAASKVGVMPAAAGLFIQHAFGYGLPLVLGDAAESHGPEADLVVPGETGIFCRDGDPADLARTVLRLLDDEALRRRLATAGRAVIERRHNLPQMAAGMCAAVEYCLRRTRRWGRATTG
jgi:glycosyltransferase involved in cell wall biosynthesis